MYYFIDLNDEYWLMIGDCHVLPFLYIYKYEETEGNESSEKLLTVSYRYFVWLEFLLILSNIGAITGSIRNF